MFDEFMHHIVPEIAVLAKEYSMDQCSAVELKRPLTIDYYKSWLDQDYHGTMSYLAEHLPLKENPQKFLPSARSALVFAKAYLPHPKPLAAPSVTRRALYAQGEDYHHWFKADLTAIAERLQIQFPGSHFFAMTDSSPVLERDLAQRAGLGWFGKNTCLIHPKKGSLFFIGELYTNLTLQELQGPHSTRSEARTTSPIPDLCGKCNRCIEVCPTQALLEPRVLDATKCISYLTIESKALPPPALREKIGDWFFGCDLCQTVCPWNQKVFGQLPDEKAQPEKSQEPRQALILELKELLTLSGKKLQKKFAGTALARAGAFGLRRNAIVVATNKGLHELLPEITSHEQDQRLKDLVLWSRNHLTQLSS